MAEMIESPESYFSKFRPEVSDQIRRLEEEAETENIPIVGPVMAQMLYLLARSAGAVNILECGSAIGYSSIFLAKACKINNGRLITYEIDAGMAKRAKANLSEAGLQRFAEVRHADVLADITKIEEPMDMIFMDVDKEMYATLLPSCKALLSPRGLLVADNTGFKDADEFNRAIRRDPVWESINLWSFLPGHSPGYDGFCIAMKASEIL